MRGLPTVVTVVAVLDWIGWASGVKVLTQLVPGWPQMTPWTALWLAALATALLLQISPQAPRRNVLVARTISLAVGLMAAVILAEYLNDVAFGLDTWWFGTAVSTLQSSYPGRPSPQTTITVLALAPVVGMVRLNWAGVRLLWPIGVVVAFAIPVIALGGYLFNAAAIHSVAVSTGMALLTALCLLMLATTCALLRTDRPPQSWFNRLPDPVPVRRSVIVLAGLPLATAVGRDVAVALGAEPNAALVIGLTAASALLAAAVYASSLSEQRTATEKIRLAEQLATANAQYRLLSEHGSDLIVSGSPDGGIAWVSPSVASALGWQPQEFAELGLSRLIHPDDVADTRAALTAADHGGTSTCEVRLQRNDGTYAWFDGRISAVHDAQGDLVERIMAWRDVDAEHRAQQDVQDARTMLRSHVDAVLDPLVLIQAVRDDTGRIVDFIYLDVNEATCRYLSLAREALVGTRLLASSPGLDEAGLIAVYARAIESAGSLSFDGFRYANEILGIEAFYDIRGRCLAGDRLSLTWRDVTERESARVRMAESEERLRTTLDSLLDPHAVLEALRDDAGNIIDFVYKDANAAAAEFNGVSREGLIGRRLLELYPAPETTALLADYVRVVETGEPIVLDDWAYPHDDGVRRYDVRAVKQGDGVSQTWRDVTERYEAARRIAAAEEQYRLLADNSADVVLRVHDDVIVWMSSSVTGVLGGDPEEWLGKNVIDLVHPGDRPTYTTDMAQVSAGKAVVRRLRFRAWDDTYHWIEAHTKAFITTSGRQEGFVTSLRVVDSEVAAEQDLERLARFDMLTGVLNRTEALARLKAAMAHPRQPGTENGVLFCDVDRFKEINDTYGHAAGDAVLRALSQRLRSCVRDGDIVARMGGDEFLVFLTGLHDASEAAMIAEKIRAAAAKPIPLGNGRGTTETSLSIGVVLTEPGEATDDFIERADTAMYEAKKAGRNRVTFIA